MPKSLRQQEHDTYLILVPPDFGMHAAQHLRIKVPVRWGRRGFGICLPANPNPGRIAAYRRQRECDLLGMERMVGRIKVDRGKHEPFSMWRAGRAP